MGELSKGVRSKDRNETISARNRIPVRIPLGLAQVGVDPLNEKVRNSVLEDLRFLVHLIRSISQCLNEEGLDEAMPSHHCESNG